MADVGDKVSVASKSGPRLGVVLSTSGSMLQVRWESGEETSLIPGPGTLTVLGKTRKRSPGAAKVKPGRSAAKAPTRAKAKTPATKKEARMDSRIVGKSEHGHPVRPGPPGKRVSPVST